MENQKTINNLFITITAVVALFALTVVFNWIISYTAFRWDVTEGKIYTLSDTSKEIVANLQTPITIKFYFTQSNVRTPVKFKNFAKRISDLLDEYNSAGSGNVILKKYDPLMGSDEEDSANLDGITSQMLKTGESIYLGLAVTYLDKTETIPFLSMKKEQSLEYEITRSIKNVISDKKKVVGIISTLPVMGIKNPAVIKKNYNLLKPWVVFGELKRNFDIKEIPTSIKEIPSDIDVLILIHPIGLTKDAKITIEQFLLKGGSVLALVDPHSLYYNTKVKQNKGYAAVVSSVTGMKEFFDAWGVKMQPYQVVSDMLYASRYQSNQKVFTHTTILTLTSNAFNKESIITNQISKLGFAANGAIFTKPTRDLTHTPLITSSQDSEIISSETVNINDSGTILKNFKADTSKYDICVHISGLFKSVFFKDKNVQNMLYLSQKPGNVIIIADTDFLHNEMTVTKQKNAIGEEVYVPINDNLKFFQNVVEYLSSGNELIKIRNRKKITRPLLVLNEIKAEKEKEFKKEIVQLEKEFKEAQEKLQRLQQLRAGDKKTLLTPEQLQERDKFIAKYDETNKKMRKLNKKFIEDVDIVINKFKWINIAMMPFLVALCGILLAFYKKGKN